MNVKWIFFDIGSTLVDESECYEARYKEMILTIYLEGNLDKTNTPILEKEIFAAIGSHPKALPNLMLRDLKIFQIALGRANCPPENAVMVGDRLDNDIIPAKKSRMKTVWVKQGFAKYQPNSDTPDYIINSLEEINNIL